MKLKKKLLAAVLVLVMALSLTACGKQSAEDYIRKELDSFKKGEGLESSAEDLSPEVLQAVQSGKFLKRDQSGDSTRGMGIGLSVCQSIIKAHGGFFAAGNNPEGGAFFRFGLPMEEENHE